MIALLLLACHHPDKGGLDAGWTGVDVTLDPLTIAWGDAVIPEGGISLGFVAAYDPTRNYDPWALYDPDQADSLPAIAWEGVREASWDGEVLQLTLDNGEAAHLSRLEGPEGLGLHLALDDADGGEPEAGASAAPYLRLSVETSDGEPLYGLGETFDAVNQRGHVRAMQIELDLDLESSYNEAHVPVPFVFGAEGWGLGLLSDEPAVVDAALADPTRVTAVVNAPAGLDLALFSAEDARDLPAQWARSTALPRRPPDWALAPMLWRNQNSGDAEVLEDATAIRDGDYAFGVMWVDNPWQTTYNSMVPDPAVFPDWTAMVDELHALGFRWMAWTTPYLEEDDPDYSSYEADDLFVDLPVSFNDFGELVDLTSDDAQARWQARVEAAKEIGIQGWKLDYGEDVQLGYGSARFVTTFSDGADERTMHHRFVESYHGAYAAPYSDGDRFLLGRAGAWGSAAITDCIWPGDLDSDLHTHGEDGHVGGLPAAIRAGVSLSMSGFPCFASDTGGYRHDRPDQETMIRWTEYSALMPVMQVGGGTEHNYWLQEGDWTAAVALAGQTYSQLHTRLFPYFQAILATAAEDGTPPVVPAALAGAAPDAPHADTTFLVGPALLVGAVDEAGVDTWDIDLPEGRWVDWWSGDAYAYGPGPVTWGAPLGEGPLLIAPGGIVPMLRETIRTIAPSTTGVESWSDDPGELVVRFNPGEGHLQVVDGPELTGAEDSLEIGDLGIYTGVSVVIWDQDATTLLLDGEAVETDKDGGFLSGIVGPGEVTWR